MAEYIQIDSIGIKNRIRKELGDIPGLAKSITENGLIEPIVITRITENDLIHIQLVAGERRLTALKSLGLTTLEHAVHYIWREELRNDDPKTKLLATSIEMEENLRRKDLTWQETVKGKAKLLEIMQQIHGLPTSGPPTRDQRLGLTEKGFGVRKLSEMLGESAAQTSEDLQLAALVSQIPILANEPSKEAAKRKIELAAKMAIGGVSPKVATPLVYKILITCDDEAQQRMLLEQLRSAGLRCLPVVS